MDRFFGVDRIFFGGTEMGPNFLLEGPNWDRIFLRGTEMGPNFFLEGPNWDRIFFGGTELGPNFFWEGPNCGPNQSVDPCGSDVNLKFDFFLMLPKNA